VQWFTKAEKDVELEEGETKTVELSPEDLTTVYKSLLGDGEKALKKDKFLQWIRFCMKVVKDTAMTNGQSIKDSTTTKRLEVHDVVEVMLGPVKDDNVAVMRIQAKLMKDGTEGWITVAGNQGTKFLEEGGYTFKVVKPTNLLDAVDADDDAKPLKKLTIGMTLEVVEWPTKEPTSGHLRMKAKCEKGGEIGYVTQQGNQGTVFLEPV